MNFEINKTTQAGMRRDMIVLTAPLALWAVAILSLFVASLSFPYSPSNAAKVEFSRYEFFAIACLIASLTGVWFLRRFPSPAIRLTATGGAAATTICMIAGVWYLVHARIPATLALFGLLGAGVAVMIGRGSARRLGQNNRIAIAALVFLSFIAMMVVTTASLQLIWWLSPSSILRQFPIIFVIFACAAFAASRFRVELRNGRRQMLWEVSGLALMLASSLFAAFCTHGLAEQGFVHHWSVYIEPAVMMRQGHWLLWDVPAQYGFLTACLTAAMPFRSVWYGFYVLNGCLMLIASLLLYYVVRSTSNHPWHALTATLIAFAAFFIVPGSIDQHVGPTGVPSTSAVRFLWCYALIALLTWEYRSGGDVRATRIALAVGTVIWLIAIFWSVECGFYETALWGPAYLLLMHRWQQRAGVRFGIKQWTSACIAPPLAMIVMGAVISIYYRIRLGQYPDWTMHWAYAGAFKEGFGWWPPNTFGNVWLLLVGFVSPMLLVSWFAVRRGPAHRSLALLAASAGMVLATSSYYVGRSHDNNVNNLLPLLVLSLAACWLVLSKERINGNIKGLMAATMFPVFVMPVAIFAAEVIATHNLGLRFAFPASETNFCMGSADRSGQVALLHAGYQKGDATLLIRVDPLPVPKPMEGIDINTLPHLLPAGPLVPVVPLGFERFRPIADRFRDCGPRSGWIILPSEYSSQYTYFRSMLLHYVDKNYVIDKLIPEYDGYVVLHCRRK